MCLNVFTVYMLLSHMLSLLCVRLTCFLIKGHLLTYLLTHLLSSNYTPTALFDSRVNISQLVFSTCYIPPRCWSLDIRSDLRDHSTSFVLMPFDICHIRLTVSLLVSVMGKLFLNVICYNYMLLVPKSDLLLLHVTVKQK